MAITKKEIDALQKYLRAQLNPKIIVVKRERISDSAEVLIDKNFIGLIYKDEDDDGSFALSMSIIKEDLELL